MNGIRTSLLGLAIAALAAGEGRAYPANQGNAYVPPPRHGLFVSSPSWAVDGSSYASWNYLGFGVTDRLSLGVDALYVAVPGFRNDLGNTTLYLNFVATQTPALRARLAPVLGLRSGAFGNSFAGLRGFFEQNPTDRLTHYTSVAYYYHPVGQVNRFKLDTALDYRVLSWFGVAMELLSGWPYWDLGPSTQLGVAPGFTLYLGPVTLQGSVRIPLIKAETVPSLEAPSVILGYAYGW